MKTIENITQTLTKKDKLLHLIGGVYLYLFLALLINSSIACGIVIIVGVMKELIWDRLLRKGTPEVMDTFMTSLGAITTHFLITL